MIFAFGPSNGFYFNDGRRAIWRNIPIGLAEQLDDVGKPWYKAENVVSLALFPDGGWFVAYHWQNDRWWSYNNLPAGLSALITTSGLAYKNITHIHHDSTSRSRFVVATHQQRIYFSNAPHGFEEAALEGALDARTVIAMGHHGTWVLETRSGHTRNRLRDATLEYMIVGGKRLQSLVLSPYSDNYAFLTYSDGSTNYFLPQSWHAAIDNLIYEKFPGLAHSYGEIPRLAHSYEDIPRLHSSNDADWYSIDGGQTRWPVKDDGEHNDGVMPMPIHGPYHDQRGASGNDGCIIM